MNNDSLTFRFYQPHWACLLFGILSLISFSSLAAVLPDERTDILYHYYDGGDHVSVQGPAALVRVNAGESVSVSGRYYMDTISSASPDVVSSASPYRDKREEFGLGVDYLQGNSLVQLFLSTSKESDYQADTFGIGTSHDLFNGLTTITLGYTQGRDQVERVDTSFEAGIDRYQYRAGLSQVLTRSLLLGVNYEGIADRGYLNNPYRSVRVLGAWQPEIYPHSRDSQALSFNLIQGFPSQTRAIGSSLRGEYRFFRDNWGIRSNTLTVGYQHYFGQSWLGELHTRYYEQTSASFYSDDFPSVMTYMARDKELSTFKSYSLGVKATWNFLRHRFLFFDRASLNLSHDLIFFDYQDYSNVLNGRLYSFSANVYQLFISAWY